jgi:membrane-bound serine protease (ClpP class)
MNESHFAILLLMLGLALLVAEVFIPSGGLLMTASVLSLAASIWFAWKAWWYSNPYAWWIYLGSVVALLPVSAGGAFYFLPRTSIGRRVLLEAPAPEEVRAYAREQERLAGLIGREGKTVTLLNPGGLVIVNGERLHCESEGVVIDPGERVTIVGVAGNRLVVRREEASPDAPPDVAFDATRTDQPPLDFDLPQG